MKKTISVSVMIIVVVVTLFAGGQGEGAQMEPEEQAEPIVLRFAVLPNLPHPFAISAYHFAEQIQERTNGAIEVTVHPGAQLGGEYEYVQGMQLGTIDLAVSATASFGGLESRYELLSVPFLFSSYEHYDRFTESEIGEELGGFMNDHGIILLAWHESGMQGFYNSQRPIESVDDMDGLTMRTIESPVMVNSMQAYGARSVPLAFPEFYGAMQTGIVDGGENGINVYVTASHYEVAPYFTVSNHRLLTSAILMSEQSMQKVPEQYHELFREVAVEAAQVGMQAGRDAEAGLYEQVVEEFGTTLTVLTDEAREGFAEAVAPIAQSVAAQNDMEDVLQGIIELRD